MLIHHIPAFCLITAAPLWLVRLVVLVRDWSLCITATIQSNLCAKCQQLLVVV